MLLLSNIRVSSCLLIKCGFNPCRVRVRYPSLHTAHSASSFLQAQHGTVLAFLGLAASAFGGGGAGCDCFGTGAAFPPEWKWNAARLVKLVAGND